MRIAITKPLFAWDCLDDSLNIKAIKQFLRTVPDAKLLASLRQWRGRGRDDYPVHVLWGVCLLTPLLRHSSTEATLDDLRRNADLRRIEANTQNSRPPETGKSQQRLAGPARRYRRPHALDCSLVAPGRTQFKYPMTQTGNGMVPLAFYSKAPAILAEP